MLNVYGKKIVLINCVSLFLIVLMFSAVTASTSEYTVGVEAGDWAGYGDVYFEWDSNFPGQEEPPPELNMSWMDMEVLAVDNNNVTLRSTAIYKNGTEETYELWGDISTGEGNLSVSIIPSNLAAGEEIPANLTWYTEEPLKLSVNGTVTRKYAGANREVNYVNITYPMISGNVTYGALNITYYWDKKTGIMCEEEVSYAMSYTVNTTQYYYNMSMSWRMTATNMWPSVFCAHDGYAFNVTMIGNSTISDFNFSEALMQISFNVTCPTGKAGYCNVTVPKELLDGDPWTIWVNTTDLTELCDVNGNYSHTFIYIPYTCSSSIIRIEGTSVIPEFPSGLVMPLLMIATLLAAIVYRRKTSN